ncbi:unnamed protein product [Mytilus edulis]|uniref:Uncharacterized protein n=1 Tax=Mytilus edulis TaxID=6550 RepID=A0A8S3T5R6_MYTED|nr:unnamed protein product [Mytilus edulis]
MMNTHQTPIVIPFGESAAPTEIKKHVTDTIARTITKHYTDEGILGNYAHKDDLFGYFISRTTLTRSNSYFECELVEVNVITLEGTEDNKVKGNEDTDSDDEDKKNKNSEDEDFENKDLEDEHLENKNCGDGDLEKKNYKDGDLDKKNVEDGDLDKKEY